MPMRTIWKKATGAALLYDTVDAREILASSPDLYTSINPNPPTVEEAAATLAITPRNVTDVENEYRREPMGENPVEEPIERGRPIIRNATGAPRSGVGLPRHDDFVRAREHSERRA